MNEETLQIEVVALGEMLSEASKSSIGAAIEANLIAQVRFFGRSPSVIFYDEINMTRVVSGLPVSILNLVAGATLSEDNIDSEIDSALEPFKKQEVPLIWWIGPTSLPRNLGTYLEQHGLEKAFDMPGMFYELENLEEDLDFPPKFAFTVVDNDALLRTWAETQAKGFGGSQPETDYIFHFERTLGTDPDSSWVRYIGFIDEEPVGVSILYLAAGVAAIFNVAVVPQFRRQGIGTLMTKVPLLNARSLGYRYGVLKASPMGGYLYRKMGFTECCQIGLYHLPLKEI